MKTLVFGSLQGDIGLAQAIQASLTDQGIATCVLGDHFGLEEAGALAVAEWLAEQLAADPMFHVVAGEQDLPILWPDHWRSQSFPIPSWAADVRAALGSQLSKIRLVVQDQGVIYTHAGITSQAVSVLGGVASDTLRQADEQALAALATNGQHVLLSPATGVLDSNWRLTSWTPSVLQAVSHPKIAPPPGYFLHPQYRSGVVHVGGRGFAVIRDGQQVNLETLPVVP